MRGDGRDLKNIVGLSGLCVGPDDVYLGLRGLRTLAVRLERHYHSGLAVARWLEQRPEVLRLLHPAMPSHPGHALWKRDFSGASGLFSVVLKPVPQKAVNAFLDALELFGIGASWGGFESLAIPFDCADVRTATPWAPGGPPCASISASKPSRTCSPTSNAALRRSPPPQASDFVSARPARAGRHLPGGGRDALPRRPRKGAQIARREDQPARREKPPHHKRAHDADQSAGKNVARMMHIHHDRAEHDDESIQPHDGPQPRPDRAERDRRRRRRGRMSGRHACVFGQPDERPVRERIVVRTDIRPRAADHPLDDGVEQARRADGQKQKAARAASTPAPPASSRQFRRHEFAASSKTNESQRIKKPAGQAEIGDRIGGLHHPLRQVPRPFTRRVVDEEH